MNSGTCIWTLAIHKTWMVFPFLILVVLDGCHGNHDAKRLYDDLLKKKGYNTLVRPVANYTEAVKVKFGLKFAQLIDVVSLFLFLLVQ